MQILRKTEEIIYPSSNAHPTFFRLSEVDQCFFNTVPNLYFYKQGPASSQPLKSSLSRLLSFYYPAAGRLVPRTPETAYTSSSVKGGEEGVEGTCKKAVGGGASDGTSSGGARARLDVSCLDQGVLFCEAWADERLEVFGPDIQPHPLLAVPGNEDFLLRVQMTHFLCGGVCLCVVCHHCLFDGTAFVHFMSSWVEIMSGLETPSTLPYLSNLPLEVRYGLEEIHSLNVDDYSHYYYPLPFDLTKELTSKLFHFSPQFIDNLKKATSNESDTYSSFECIAAFIWRNLTLARGIPPNEEVCLYYLVDGRRKLVPPLPSSYLGNVIFKTHASAKVSDLIEKPLPYVTNLIRRATSKVTNAHIRSVLDWSIRQPLPMSFPECFSPHMLINSWASYPFDFDFGWGKSLCWRHLPLGEYVLVLQSCLGKGYMDVLVYLNEEHMSKLSPLMSEEHFELNVRSCLL